MEATTAGRKLAMIMAVVSRCCLAMTLLLAWNSSMAETRSPCSVVATGVGDMASTNFALQATMGEPFIDFFASTTSTVAAGFWHCASGDSDGDGIPDPTDPCTDSDGDG